jgi:hypothetical protein
VTRTGATTTHIVILRTITSADPTVGSEAFWDGKHYPTEESAITGGFNDYGASRLDDFNVGRVQNGRLVWFGWMFRHELDSDRIRVAQQIGLKS